MVLRIEYYYQILCIIRDLTEKKIKKINKSEICKSVSVTYKTLTHILDTFVAIGVLDRNKHIYSISKEGQLLLNELDILYTFLSQLDELDERN